MLAPINWLKEYVGINVDTKELADKLTMTGTHVESIINLDKKIENVYLGRITKIESHPDADKLQIVEVDIKKEKLTLITGAKNIKVNDLVPVAVEGAILYNNTKIEETEFRGIISQGMLCSYEELGVDSSLIPKESRDGIIIINEDFDLGTDITDVLDLKGYILDLEITFNRPDCLSMVGIGREISATLNTEFRYPKIKINNEVEDIKEFIEDIQILDKDLCRRYYTRVIKDVNIGPSPLWLQRKIMDAGMRPINNIVDATNYVMLELGQPLHAFDLETIQGKKIQVRKAKKGEKLLTLDKINRELDEDMLVIADEKKPIGIAGVMGGFDSEVTVDTDVILMESANFNGLSVRETSKKLGLRSEASSRNEKNLPNEIVVDACNRVCQIIEEIGAGKIVNNFIDVGEKGSEEKTVQLNPINCNNLLGTDIKPKDMINILNSLSIESELKENIVYSKIPYFRKDIVIEADLIEEVGRIFGFENIKPQPLYGSILKGSKSPLRKTEDKVKEFFWGSGLYEITTYSFISPKEYNKLNLEKENPLRDYIEITNPLGEDFSSMRTTLLPNMLKIISKNLNYDIENGMLFETGNIFKSNKNNLPEEIKNICIGIYGKYDFYNIKGLVENFFNKFGINPIFKEKSNISYLHSGRTAEIIYKGDTLGILGELHPKVGDNYDIDERVYVSELNLNKVLEYKIEDKFYKKIPKYPSTSRDISIIVDEDITVGSIIEEIKSMNFKELEKIEFFDVYRDDSIGINKKSLAFSMVFRSKERTLLENEINKCYDEILNKLERVFNAQLR